jgi:hypothetical protein
MRIAPEKEISIFCSKSTRNCYMKHKHKLIFNRINLFRSHFLATHMCANAFPILQNTFRKPMRIWSSANFLLQLLSTENAFHEAVIWVLGTGKCYRGLRNNICWAFCEKVAYRRRCVRRCYRGEKSMNCFSTNPAVFLRITSRKRLVTLKQNFHWLNGKKNSISVQPLRLNWTIASTFWGAGGKIRDTDNLSPGRLVPFNPFNNDCFCLLNGNPRLLVTYIRL